MSMRRVPVLQASGTDAAGVSLLSARLPQDDEMKSTHEKALDPWQIRELQDAKRRGATVDGLADRFGVSRRTIYRYLDGRVERTYALDGWSAFFFYTNDRAPQRLTEWER